MRRFPKGFGFLIVMLVAMVCFIPKLNASMKTGSAYAAHAYEYTTESYTWVYEETTTELDLRDPRETTCNYDSTTGDWGWLTTTEIDLGDPRETTCDYNSTTAIDLGDPRETTTYQYDVTTEWYDTTHPETTSPYKRVESIYIPNMTFIENYDGYWSSDYYWDEVNGDCYCDYYRYYIYPEEVTIIFSDGTRFIGNIGEVDSVTGYTLTINDNQSYENQWTAGDYYVTAMLGNAKTTYKVTILDTPVESINVKIKNNKLVENVDGHLSYSLDDDGNIENAYFYYELWDCYDIEVVFKDGFEHYEETYGYSLFDGQSYYMPWGVGKHTVTVSCLGYETDFEVEVVANPNNVVSVSAVAQKILYEGFDGYYSQYSIFDEDTQDYTEITCFEYFIYDTEPLITITYEDGTVISGLADDIYEKTGKYPSITSNQSAYNQWGIGTHTAYITFGDKLVPYEVEVFASLVKNIEFIKTPNKTVYVVGEYPDLTGAVIRINYISGDYLDVELDDSESKLVFDKIMNRKYRLRFDTGTDSGGFTSTNQTLVTVTYGDFSCNLNVSVKENITDKIIISNSENDKLLITVYNTDGTSNTVTVLGFLYSSGDGFDNFVMRGGRLYTDCGIFNVVIYKYNNGLYCLDMQIGENNERMKSNYLNGSPWMEAWFLANNLANSIFYGDTECFNGEITKENIDDIVFQAVYSSEEMLSNINYPYFAGEDIRSAVMNVFDVEGVELSISSNYNPLNDTFKVISDYGGNRDVLRPYNLIYQNDLWLFEICFIDSEIDAQMSGEYLYVLLDKDLRVLSYNIGSKPVVSDFSVEIINPSEKEITYGDSIILHADIVGTLPKGYSIQWTADNSNFDIVIAEDGKTCKITSKANGSTVISVRVVDSEGKTIAESAQTMVSKAGFFDKIIAFFKKMFGLLKIYQQSL